MKLGEFSVSLNVKDIAVSKAFYEKPGFSTFGGNQAQNWLIMKNGNDHIIVDPDGNTILIDQHV